MHMYNLYYSPEKYNFKVVDEIEWREESYEFDITVLWQAGDGRFYIADDSGCSCPSPFETLESEELTEVTMLQELIDYLGERSDNSARVTGEVASMIQKYRDLKNN